MLSLPIWVLLACIFDENQHVKAVERLDQDISWWDCKDKQWDVMQDAPALFDLSNGDYVIVVCTVDEGSI